jgi:hypothetical protein
LLAQAIPGSDYMLPLRTWRQPNLTDGHSTEKKPFFGIEQPARVERPLDAPLLVQLLPGELHRHQLALLDGHAKSAGRRMSAPKLSSLRKAFGIVGITR